MQYKVVLFTLVVYLLCPAQTLPNELGRSDVMFRKDGRCGIDYLTEAGLPAQCDPTAQGNELGPCCSQASWCGDSAEHCTCSGCIDYSNQVIDQEVSDISPFDQLSDLLTAVSGDSLSYDYGDSLHYDSDDSSDTSSNTSPPPPFDKPQSDQPANICEPVHMSG